MNNVVPVQGLSPQEVELLNAPFPEEVLDVYQGFTYIGVEYVIERLNTVFNYNWDFTAKTTVGEKETRKGQKGEYIVTPVYADVTLTVRSITGATIVRFGSGGGVIGYGKSEGDGHKSAVSDALKKAAQSLGVGLYIAMEAKKAKKAQRRASRGGNRSSFSPPNIGPAAAANTAPQQPAATGGFRPPVPV